MKTEKALEICRQWFAHIERQRLNSLELQRAAQLARQGNQAEARRIKSRIDLAPRVFDGACLRPAVEHLVSLVEEARK